MLPPTRPPAPVAPLRPKHALGLFFRFIGFQLLVGGVVVTANLLFLLLKGQAITEYGWIKLPLVSTIAGSAAAAMAIHRGWRESGQPWTALVPLRLDRVTFIAGTMFLFGCSFLVSELHNLAVWLLPLPPWALRTTVEPGRMAVTELFLSTVIFAPVFEEIFFRGVILRRLQAGVGTPRALLLSAALFGLAHFFPLQASLTFLIGLASGWVFLRTGSLAVPMAGHALNNLLAVLGTIPSEKIPGLNAGHPVSGVLQLQPWWTDALGLSLFAVGIVLLCRRTPPIPVGTPAPSPTGIEVSSVPPA